MIKNFMNLCLVSLLTLCFWNAPTFAAHTKKTNSVDKTAEDFVQHIGDYMITVLSDRSANQDAKEAKFRALLKKDFDLTAIGKFTLGRYLPKIQGADLGTFLEKFEDLIVEMYASQFKNYKDQKLVVDRSTKKDGAIFVYSRITKADAPAIEVAWRLFNVNGQFKVVDAIVAKVSMSMSQRREFAEFFQQCNGEVPCFLAKIKEQAARFDRMTKTDEPPAKKRKTEAGAAQ